MSMHMVLRFVGLWWLELCEERSGAGERNNGVRDTALGQRSRERQAQVSLPNHVRQTRQSGSHPPRAIFVYFAPSHVLPLHHRPEALQGACCTMWPALLALGICNDVVRATRSTLSAARSSLSRSCGHYWTGSRMCASILHD